jgi:hypothetical protein
MSRRLFSRKRAAISLALLNAVAIAVTVGCFASARRFHEHGEEAFVALANDMTRVSQAQGAAERMVASVEAIS